MTSLTGCFELIPNKFTDHRGSFLKTFHSPEFEELGIDVNFQEEFFTRSHKGVIRGLHFQAPPYDHSKLVCCVNGEVLDVVVDLRLGSPTYGGVASVNLSAEVGNMLFIPRGFAHGFKAITSDAVMFYKVETVHEPAADSGILWSSIDFEWQIAAPIVSQRDNSFEALEEFKSPFHYE